MLHLLKLHQVGPATDLELTPIAPRLNLITGDNGLGKSFLLEIAWWALTRTWNGFPAVPTAPDAALSFKFDGATTPRQYTSKWAPEGQEWRRKAGRPPNPGMVLYAGVDGSFSVWDPLRNYRLYRRRDGGKAESPPSYRFTSNNVLWGLHRTVSDGGREHRETLCLGLVDEWREWQRADDPRFELLKQLLSDLGPDGQPLEPGELLRPTVDDVRLIPTIRMPYGQDVPITYAPAGVQRMCKLAYLLTWAISEHAFEAERQGREPTNDLIVLVDELETHLHPRWQRTVLPSLLQTLERWGPGQRANVQLMVVTHSPMVLASAEPLFDPDRDALWKLDFDANAGVRIEKDTWHRRGDVSTWLTSDVFDLGQARSRPGEQAIERALALYREPQPSLTEIQEVTDALRASLSDTDRFWLRWSAFAEQHGVPT